MSGYNSTGNHNWRRTSYASVVGRGAAHRLHSGAVRQKESGVPAAGGAVPQPYGLFRGADGLYRQEGRPVPGGHELPVFQPEDSDLGAVPLCYPGTAGLHCGPGPLSVPAVPAGDGLPVFHALRPAESAAGPEAGAGAAYCFPGALLPQCVSEPGDEGASSQGCTGPVFLYLGYVLCGAGGRAAGCGILFHHHALFQTEISAHRHLSGGAGHSVCDILRPGPGTDLPVLQLRLYLDQGCGLSAIRPQHRRLYGPGGG